MRHPLLAALFVVTAFAVATVAASRDDRPAEDAEAAPTVVFERLDGSSGRLQDWSGTPLVVNFWASWCPPCVAEMRDTLEPAARELDGRVAFLGLNLRDDPDRAAEVVAATGVTYHLGRDPTGELFTAFGGLGMPTTVLVDADSQVVAVHSGTLSRADLDRLIARHFGS